MLDEAHLHALSVLYQVLEGSQVNWILTGSTGMALQGMPLEVHDIDVQTDQAGAYEIESMLREYVTRPVAFVCNERMRSHYGGLVIDGIEVEIMGDIQKPLPGGGWEEPEDLRRYKRWIPLQGMWIPVFSLAFEAEAYAKLGRVEKSARLRAWAEAHPEDRLETITNFMVWDDLTASAGQPIPPQFPALAAAGYQVNLNLAMPDGTAALADEAELSAANGLEYLNIPVVWTEPTLDNLEQFFQAVDSRAGKKVFVHCVLNYRASCFLYLYRSLRLGLPEEAARAQMNKIWQPSGVWQQYIQAALARYRA